MRGVIGSRALREGRGSPAPNTAGKLARSQSPAACSTSTRVAASGVIGFAGIEEHQVGVARLHQDRRVGLRAASLAGGELGQHQPPEPALQYPHEPPHAGKHTSPGDQ